MLQPKKVTIYMKENNLKGRYILTGMAKFDRLFVFILLLFLYLCHMLEKNEIIQSVLRNLRIEELNPMQEASLEQATGKKDVILLSPTGSGKTLAYLLPLLLTLKTDDGSVQVLILVPSRELALQIDSVFKAMGTSWKTCCCYGGHPIAEEKRVF